MMSRKRLKHLKSTKPPQIGDYSEVFGGSGGGSVRDVASVSEGLQHLSLSDLLAEDQLKAAEDNRRISWYHGNVSREKAEARLRVGGPVSSGHFLIRDCSSTPGDFVLSLTTADDAVQHFQILWGGIYFALEDGPIKHGLDQLVDFYRQAPHGLPCQLTTFAVENPPPHFARRFGRTNSLHRAILEGNSLLVSRILEDPLRPDVNEKNAAGSTALHDASYHGYNGLVVQLLQAGADVEIKDATGCTPLQRACAGNRPATIYILIVQGGADVQERCPLNGWVPLHEAASHGHLDCVKVLLALHAPLRPRTDREETPLALAERHPDVVHLLDNYKCPRERSTRADWFHESLDRGGAISLLERFGGGDGLFLVRRSGQKHRSNTTFVLSMAWKGTSFNYEIQIRDGFVFIDDGPLFESLEQLVDHYWLRADGLPTRLASAVAPEHHASYDKAESDEGRGLVSNPLALPGIGGTGSGNDDVAGGAAASSSSASASQAALDWTTLLNGDLIPDYVQKTVKDHLSSSSSSRSPRPLSSTPVGGGGVDLSPAGIDDVIRQSSSSSNSSPAAAAASGSVNSSPSNNVAARLNNQRHSPVDHVSAAAAETASHGNHSTSSPSASPSFHHHSHHQHHHSPSPSPSKSSHHGSPSSASSSSHPPPPLPPGSGRPRRQPPPKIPPPPVPRHSHGSSSSSSSPAANPNNASPGGKMSKTSRQNSAAAAAAAAVAAASSTAGSVSSSASLRNVQLDSSKLKTGKTLGQGEFGAVLQGTYASPDGKIVDVAIKTLLLEQIAGPRAKDDFLREAKVMAGLDHPCIVKLVGVCEGPPLMLVQELVSMGSVLDYLLDHPDRVDVDKDLKLWAAQTAFGMQYLETKRFVHRDLAARNLLLDDKKQLKISDFGLSRAVGVDSNYYRSFTGGRWPVKWYAPESINYGTFSHSSDVWSFGVTLWEMFSFGEQPYGNASGAEVVVFLDQNKRLERPKKCPNRTYNLMLKCWSYDPGQRPTFRQLHKYFSEDEEYASVQEMMRALQHKNGVAAAAGMSAAAAAAAAGFNPGDGPVV